MAKVIITLTDGKDGLVKCGVEFSPKWKGEKKTPAQCAAFVMLEAVAASSEETNVTSVDGKKVG